jgi:hypothetical protein
MTREECKVHRGNIERAQDALLSAISDAVDAGAYLTLRVDTRVRGDGTMYHVPHYTVGHLVKVKEEDAPP